MTTKNYSFWYSEVFSHRGYFKADSIQEADEMLRLLNAGDIGLDDLPSFKSKGVEYELVTEQAEPEQSAPPAESLHYRKMFLDFMSGDSVDSIRERFDGLLPDAELEATLAFLMHRFTDTRLES